MYAICIFQRTLSTFYEGYIEKASRNYFNLLDQVSRLIMTKNSSAHRATEFKLCRTFFGFSYH